MHVPVQSPFFMRLYLIQKGRAVLEEGTPLPSPFDLVLQSMLVAVPGSSVGQVRSLAAEEDLFDPTRHSIAEVQWVGDEQAILGRTLAIIAMPSGDRFAPYVFYGPFRDGSTAEAWLLGKFPLTAPRGRVLYPIPNAFSLCLHTWRAEMQGVLENRLDETSCRFGDPKQKLLPPPSGKPIARAQGRPEPAFDRVDRNATQSVIRSEQNIAEQRVLTEKILSLVEPAALDEARRLVAQLQNAITRNA
ncbi:hypothetical protein RAS12_30640 (plasmid) [Achromobacter seleniivolatilans]|uniref:Uncharacterized protein n=1 Tax=Achromobacter seleniivolatilans TaxID=3047478 RepID=A0ABY9MAI4_9BURK|nr:hypothetical protein [Achromobacter sp. R39]WMD23993.1 hypothetical protein RAS12_30640 [Achromobacter sp. R39]